MNALLEALQQRTKGVLFGFPLDYEPAIITDQPSGLHVVLVVTRHGEKVVMRSVEVFFRGSALPEMMNLSWFGAFKIREFPREPPHC